MTIELGKRYQTRGEKLPAEVIRGDLKGTDGPFAAVVTRSDGTHFIIRCHASGRYLGGGLGHHLDLIPVPETVVRYIAMTKDDFSFYRSTLVEAEHCALRDCLAIAKLTFDPESMTIHSEIVRRYDQ